MTHTRSIWSLISLVIVFGCSSHSIDKKQELDQAIDQCSLDDGQDRRELKPQCQIRLLSPSQRIALNPGEAVPEPKVLKDFLCRNGKQAQKLETFVTVELPKSEPGTPLDIAQEQRMRLIEYVDFHINELFVLPANRSFIEGNKPPELKAHNLGADLVTIHPLNGHNHIKYKAEAHFFDIPIWLATHFIMVFSVKEQRRLGIQGYRDEPYGFDGTRFLPSLLLEQADYLWREIMIKSTHIQKVPTDSPRVFRYSVTLNLNLFCAYGRPVSDFLSR